MKTIQNFQRKDRVLQAGCFILYAVALMLWVINGFWYLFAGLFLLHFAELLVKGWRIGAQAGKPAWVTILMTMVCGYTWWLPLEKSLGDAKGQENS